MSEKILMNEGVALWLVRYTKLSNKQIADFCSLHPFAVNALRFSHRGINECNPIHTLMLTEEDIYAAEKNQNLSLKEKKPSSLKNTFKNSELANAIAWIIVHYPNLEIKKITQLLSCTKENINSIKLKMENNQDFILKNPVSAGLCSQEELDKILVS